MRGVIAAIIALCLMAMAYGYITDRALRKHNEADTKGAENVRETTKGTLDGIADDADPIGLLKDTNGLRDDD